MVIYSLQKYYGLEKYITLNTNIIVDNNILDIEELPQMNKTLDYLIRHIIENHLSLKYKTQSSNFAIIKISCFIEYFDRDAFLSSGYFKEYTKYKDKMNKDIFTPIILAHPNVINDYCQKKFNTLFCVDGMHRIMSTLENDKNKILSYLVFNKSELWKFLDLNILKLNTILNFKYFDFIYSWDKLTIDKKIIKSIKSITIYGINLSIIIEFILKKIKINGIYDISKTKAMYIKNFINKIFIGSLEFKSNIHDWFYIDTFKYKNINFLNPNKGYIVYGDNYDVLKYKSKQLIGKLNNNNVFLLLK
jgi:hypothetical protein